MSTEYVLLAQVVPPTKGVSWVEKWLSGNLDLMRHLVANLCIKLKFVSFPYRVNILVLACKNGYKPCLEGAGNAFLAWISDKSAYIPPNLRTTAYK